MKRSLDEERLAEQISLQLRHTLSDNNLSINEAANLLQVTSRTIYNYVNGLTVPSPEVLRRMISLWNLKLTVTGTTIESTHRGHPQRFNTDITSLINNNMPDRFRIFLCHASEDKARVRQLYTQLQDDGFLPWLDAEDLLPGEDWDPAIRQAVRGSDVVLVCLSSHAVQKTGYVQKEIAQALDVAEEKPESTIYIIPVLLEQCSVPNRIKKWHWVDLSSSAGYEKLLRALKLRAEQLGHDVTRLGAKIRTRIIERFAKSGSFRSAEENARELCRYKPFSGNEMDKILAAAADNAQIWCAAAIPEILERIVSHYGPLAKPEIHQQYLDALKRRH
ncbi:MAG TPA: TIR domain-containing protein [Candidatus Angelobacter sp.]